MLLFLSDLHLTDTLDRSTIDLTRLSEALDHQLDYAVRKRGIREVTLVLLGDIFELLKSRLWLERGLRPWEAVTPAHVQLVGDVFEAVVGANRPFWEDLKRLCQDYPLKLEYLPGNHDLYINTPMGKQACRRFQELLPFRQAGGRPFEPILPDSRHGVLAKHGHEWDPTNRYGKDNGTVAIGDAIVLEVLLRLPGLVAEALGSSAEDPHLAFLHEIDNVRPQHPRALAHWLLAGLDGLEEMTLARSARRSIEEGFQQLAKNLMALVDRVAFESTREIRWWEKFLLRTARALLKKPGMLRLAVRLPWGGRGPSSYRQDALRDLEDAMTFVGDLRYVLCGHTHLHELIPLESSRGGLPCLYINTGTWRRTHRLAEVSFGKAPHTFSTIQEECLVSIYDSTEQRGGLPPYEAHLFTSGRASY
jgi:UDP-2,3-diacylglucosamine pyrophosphatase LpxH